MMTPRKIKHRPVYNGEPEGDYPDFMHHAHARWKSVGGNPDFNILNIKDQGLKQEIAITTGFKYNPSCFPHDLLSLYKGKDIQPLDRKPCDPLLPNDVWMDGLYNFVFIRFPIMGVKVDWLFKNEEHWKYEEPYSEENFSVKYKFSSSDRVPHKWPNYHRK